jgi:hypothetical protein
MAGLKALRSPPLVFKVSAPTACQSVRRRSLPGGLGQNREKVWGWHVSTQALADLGPSGGYQG